MPLSREQRGPAEAVSARGCIKHYDTRLLLLGNSPFSAYSDSTLVLPLDPDHLPKDIDLLHKIVVELRERLKHEKSEKDKYRSLLHELLEAQRNRKSEQLSKDQLALFETLWKAGHPEGPEPEQPEAEQDAEPTAEQEQKPEESQSKKRSGRQPLARHLVRERVVHDLAESEKHCHGCGKDLHLLGEETSERYEFIPAVMR